MKKIAVLVGSNRKESINLKFAKALEKLAGDRLRFEYADLVSLPMYNDDEVPNYPAAAQALKDLIEGADGVLLLTPEFNRSIPPLLKNAIDWASRPWGKNSWIGKPAAVVGASPGVIGAAAAQAHLRSIMVVLGTVLMGRPEVYLQVKPGLFDENFDITDPDTRTFLGDFIDNFVAWVDADAKRSAA